MVLSWLWGRGWVCCQGEEGMPSAWRAAAHHGGGMFHTRRRQRRLLAVLGQQEERGTRMASARRAWGGARGSRQPWARRRYEWTRQGGCGRLATATGDVTMLAGEGDGNPGSGWVAGHGVCGHGVCSHREVEGLCAVTGETMIMGKRWRCIRPVHGGDGVLAVKGRKKEYNVGI